MEIKFDPPPKAKKSDIVSLDCEIFNLDKKHLHLPGGKFALAQCTFDGNTVFICKDQRKLQSWYNRIKDAVLIGHNIGFDFTQLRQWIIMPDAKVWDTLWIETLLYSGFYHKFSLKDLTRRYFRKAMDKETREDFYEEKEITDQMIEYSALDVIYTLKIYYKQLKVCPEAIQKLWFEIEMPTMWALLSRRSFAFDSELWTKAYNEHLSKAKEMQDKYPETNLNAPAQVVQLLKDNKIKVQDSNEKTLQQHNQKPIVQDILTYRMYAKRSSTYGISWLDHVINGKIHTHYKLLGTETGRISSDAPNIANIPSKDTKVFRKCFTASKYCKIIIADYSAQEPRLTAFYSKDENMIKIFTEDRDIHSEVATQIFKRKITKANKVERSIGKAVGLGTTYGLTGKGLMNNATLLEQGIELTREEADKFINQFLNAFPNIRDWIQYQRDFAQECGYVEDLLGRRIWINPYNYQWANNAINAPVQAGGASMIKLAIRLTYERWNDKWGQYGLVQTTYDEIGFEFDDMYAEEGKDFVKRCMEDAGNELLQGIVPCKADVEICNNWSEKE